MSDEQPRPAAHDPYGVPTDAPDAVATGEQQVSIRRWRIIGPGLVVAATGVGAADLVATLAAGSRYGYALLWAVIAGVIMKIILVEGAGRFSLASGLTIFQGWRSLGRWTTWYFAPYIVIWGFVYGASAMTSSALPVVELFKKYAPGVLESLGEDALRNIIAAVTGILGFLMVWFGRYQTFEKVVGTLVLLMMVTVVGISLFAVPNLGEAVAGLVPRIPDGGMVYVLSVAGGVGGTITLAAYGYWLREKGWAAPGWMKVMRLDNAVAYIITGVFVIATMIMGVELLYRAGLTVESSDSSLLNLAGILQDEYGTFIGTAFLVGFWAAAFSSLVGVWNGVSLMFADFLGTTRKLPADHPDLRTGGKYFKWYVLWLTFPPMLLFFLNEPTGVTIAYGVLGALFMPFLALTLLGLLNSRRVPAEWRNRWYTNVLLAIVTGLFVWLGVDNLITTITES
ncbi:Nramp family divalent metal transporter [Georgenia alba]|uniref:Nramp family divalent metal transporter n=1 Tax=Georgenia alba TaxID=2233858 RepID=A0ABW2Q9Y6_9MICO